MISINKKSLTIVSSIVLLLSLYIFIFADSPLIRQLSLISILIAVVLPYALLYMTLKSETNDSHVSNISNAGNLVQDIKHLFELLESSVKADLQVMRLESEQIKHVVSDAVKQLADSFYGVSANANNQQTLVNSLLTAINIDNQGTALSGLHEAAGKIKEYETAAIRSLQFEDIVIQIADNSIQYASDVDAFLDEIKKLLHEYLDNVHLHYGSGGRQSTIASAEQLIRSKRLLPDRKAAHQQDMTEGGIELF